MQDALEQRVRVGVAAGAHDEHIPAELLVEFIRREARPRRGEHRALDDFQLGIDADFLEFFRDDFCHFHSAVVHCAGHDGHIKAVRITGFRQQLLRLFRVVGHNADRGVTRHRGRHDAVNRGFAQATVEVFADGVAVDGVADGLTDSRDAHRRMVGSAVELEQVAAVAIGLADGHTVQRVQTNRVIRGNTVGDVRLSSFDGNRTAGLFGNNLHDDFMGEGCAFVVVLKGFKLQDLALVPLGALEGARAVNALRGLAEVSAVLFNVFRIQHECPMLRNRLQEERLGLLQGDDEGVVIRRNRRINEGRSVRGVALRIFGIQQAVKRRLEVVGGAVTARVEVHVLTQMERPRHLVLGRFIAFRHLANDVAIVVVAQQTVIVLRHNLAVGNIVLRIENILIVANDPGDGVLVAIFRGRGGRKDHRERHGEREQGSKQLLHVEFLPFYYSTILLGSTAS